MMKLVLCLLILSTSIAFGQIVQQGLPEIIKGTVKQTSHFEKLSNIDTVDQNQDPREKSFQYGKAIAVNFIFPTNYLVDTLKNGDRVYQLGIESQNAISLNVIFDLYKLKSGSTLYLVGAKTKKFIGAYTSLNNNDYETLGTELIYDEQLIIEVYEPAENIGSSQLHIDKVIHGYRNLEQLIKRKLNSSGICNIDVNCPQGNGFENQRNAVAIMINNSGGFCTGTLLNTTAGPFKPYFLSAYHCGTNPTSWIFRFRWEAPEGQTDCGTKTPSVDGPQSNTINGAALVASHKTTDFILCELNTQPDPTWNVYYNGWDKSGKIPKNGTGIHHPFADIKKISLDKDSLVEDRFNPGEPTNHWRTNWDQGITEQGSSGSPLFDQNHRVIGQLHGGDSGCISDFQTDFYGKLSVSWEGGNTSDTRLKDWLDPVNVNVDFIDGNYLNVSNDNSYDPYIKYYGTNLIGKNCTKSIKPYVILGNGGTSKLTNLSINYTYDNNSNQKISWNGSINQYEEDTIYLPIESFGEGDHTFKASLEINNDKSDNNKKNNTLKTQFYQINSGKNYTLQLQLDEYANEVVWKIRDRFEGVIYAGGPYIKPYQKVSTNFCLTEKCYTFTLTDYSGDGMVSGNKKGSYVLLDSELDTIIQLTENEANFKTTIKKEFCNLSNTNSENIITLFPNPINDNTIEINSSLESIQEVTIYAITGQKLEQLNFNSTFIHLNTAQLNSGNYLFEIKTNNHTYISRITQL